MGTRSKPHSWSHSHPFKAVSHHCLVITCHPGILDLLQGQPGCLTWGKGEEDFTWAASLLTGLIKKKQFWFPVFCECFALCLLFNSTPSASQPTDVSWKHSSLASGCKLLRCALIPPSNSCCTCWLTAVPGELLPGCDIPAGVATGGGSSYFPFCTPDLPQRKFLFTLGWASCS